MHVAKIIFWPFSTTSDMKCICLLAVKKQDVFWWFCQKTIRIASSAIFNQPYDEENTMKRVLLSAMVASTLLLSNLSYACEGSTETTPITASTRISCGTGAGVANRTVAFSEKTWGGWSQLNTDNETTNSSGTTNHINALWGYPFSHHCKVEYRTRIANGSFTKIGQWSGFCL